VFASVVNTVGGGGGGKFSISIPTKVNSQTSKNRYHLATMATRLTTKLLANGRLTIPAAIRRALSLEPGDRIHFVQLTPSSFEIVPANRSVAELKSMFGKPKEPTPAATTTRLR